MFRHLFLSKHLLAFLLPLTFIWSWAACSQLCSEISERHEQESASIIGQNGENCLNAFDLDNCPMTANSVVIQARQTIISPSLAVQTAATFQSRELRFIPSAVYPADLNQNSPPSGSSDPPLFSGTVVSEFNTSIYFDALQSCARFRACQFVF